MKSSKIQLKTLRQRREAEHSLSPGQGAAVLGALIAGLFLVFRGVTDSWAVSAGIVGGFALWVWFLSRRHHRRVRALAASRAGESICGFARAFPRGSVDPLLLRAVYEEVQDQMGDCRVPVRAMDLLETDLGLDSDDMDEVYWRIADLAGYETEGGGPNPYRGKVLTVADLVHFLQHQPRSGA